MGIILCIGPVWGASTSPSRLQQVDLLQAARQALSESHVEEATKLLEQALREDPSNGQAHYYLAQIHARADRERLALNHFNAALQALPQETIIWSEYGKWLLRRDYFEEAERVYRHLTESAPTERGHWINLGLASYRNGHPQAALESYRRGLNMGEPSADDFYLAGVASRSLGQLEEAERLLRSGLALAPRHPELRFQMGELLLQQGRPQESLTFWRGLDLPQARVDFGRGLALLRLHRPEEAQKAFESALRRDPGHPEAHYQLGLIHARRGEAAVAEGYFKRFRELEEARRQAAKTRQSKSVIRR